MPFFKTLLEYPFFLLPEMLNRMSETLTITKMCSFKHKTFFSVGGGGGGGGVLSKIKKQAPASIIAYYLKASAPQVTSVSTLDQPLQPQLNCCAGS